MVDAGLAAGRRFRPSAEGKEAGVRGGARDSVLPLRGVTGADGTSVPEAGYGSLRCLRVPAIGPAAGVA